VDRASLRCAEETLQFLWKSDTVSSKAVILVGNKTDLVRSRTVTTEGKSQGQANLEEISMLKRKAARHMSVNFPKWTIKRISARQKIVCRL
jgi:hypothetical protein